MLIKACLASNPEPLCLYMYLSAYISDCFRYYVLDNLIEYMLKLDLEASILCY